MKENTQYQFAQILISNLWHDQIQKIVQLYYIKSHVYKGFQHENFGKRIE